MKKAALSALRNDGEPLSGKLTVRTKESILKSNSSVRKNFARSYKKVQNKRRRGVTSLIDSVKPPGAPRILDPEERSLHRAGGRSRGRLADDQVKCWIAGGVANGDGKRMALLFQRLKIVPSKTQVYVSNGDKTRFAYIDIEARTLAGEVVILEQKCGFAGTFKSVYGMFKDPIANLECSPMNQALLQIGMGKVLYEECFQTPVKHALAVQVLDQKVFFHSVTPKIMECARRLLLNEPQKA